MVTDEYGRVTSRRDYTAFGEESVTPDRDPNLGYTFSITVALRSLGLFTIFKEGLG